MNKINAYSHYYLIISNLYIQLFCNVINFDYIGILIFC